MKNKITILSIIVLAFFAGYLINNNTKPENNPCNK